jgi:hypothetical protein
MGEEKARYQHHCRHEPGNNGHWTDVADWQNDASFPVLQSTSLERQQGERWATAVLLWGFRLCMVKGS